METYHRWFSWSTCNSCAGVRLKKTYPFPLSRPCGHVLATIQSVSVALTVVVVTVLSQITLQSPIQIRRSMLFETGQIISREKLGNQFWSC